MPKSRRSSIPGCKGMELLQRPLCPPAIALAPPQAVEEGDHIVEKLSLQRNARSMSSEMIWDFASRSAWPTASLMAACLACSRPPAGSEVSNVGWKRISSMTARPPGSASHGRKLNGDRAEARGTRARRRRK
jgi:hypothetical protein